MVPLANQFFADTAEKNLCEKFKYKSFHERNKQTNKQKMGGSLSMLWGWMAGSPRNARIIILGLDAAGKSTFLQKAKLGEVQATVPTIGFSVETIEYKGVAGNFTLQCWDVGGQARLRAAWSHYYENCSGVIWLVDSSDKARVAESREELASVLQAPELRNATVLVYANKQDLPGALSTTQITESLGLKDLCRTRKFFVQGSSMTTGKGINEGLEYMVSNLPPDQKQ